MTSAALLLLMLTQSPDDARVLDEVVVCGALRIAAADEVPASVAVLDRDALKRRTQNHLQDALGSIANLNWQAGSSRPRYFQIRGIGEDSLYQGAPNPSVGFLIDDVDVSGLGGVASTFDIEQIEVLRGPQGTRYGANALAGLIVVNSRAPTGTVESLSRLSFGNDGHGELGQVWSGPVSANHRLRVAALKSVQDGFRNNRFLNRDDTNQRDESLLRLRSNFTPNQALEIDTTLSRVNLANGYDAFAIDNGFATQSDRPGRDAQFSTLASIRATHSDLNGSWTAIGSHARSRSEASFDGDWGNDASWGVNAPYDFFSDTDRLRRTRSLELRRQHTIGRADWVVGAYALDLDEDLAQRDDFNGAASLALDSKYAAQSRALFVDLALAIGARDTFGIGARVEQRDADYRDSDGLELDPRDRMWGGALSYLRRELIGPLNGYATLSKGYKAGGFNLGLAIPDGRREFAPERLTSFELGLKGSSADGALSGQLALFVAPRPAGRDVVSVRSDRSTDLRVFHRQRRPRPQCRR
jgi:iron complex outermembrane recepter protein